MLAAMSSCLVRGFLLSMAVTSGVAVRLMVLAPLRLLLRFMPSRHVPTCRTPPGEGGAAKRKGRGISHPEQSGGRAKRGLHKRSAEDCWETPCAAPGRRPQRGLVSLFVRIKRTGLLGSRCGRNRPLRRVAEDAHAAAAREERSSS